MCQAVQGDGGGGGQPFDPLKAINAARRAAWYILPPRLESWREDLIQQILVHAIEEKRRGNPLPRWRWNQLAIQAMRSLFGKNRENPVKNLRLARGVLEQVASPERDAVGCALALWRLQRVWPTLTDAQRVAVRAVLMGGYGTLAEEAELAGLKKHTVTTARDPALQRIDNPSAFARVAVRRDR